VNRNLQTHSRSFARNLWFTNAMPVLAGVKLLCGIIIIVMGDIGQAALWLLMAAIWGLNYLWSSKTPFIVLSKTGLTLCPSPLTPRREIPWHAVLDAQRSGPTRLTLHLVSRPKLSIYLVWINAAERKLLLQMVEKAILEKGAKAGYEIESTR
jgi:hypothetical protein